MRLRVEGLACRRGGRDVFAGVNLAVDAGEALIVTGPNGAGKSSLLRLIAGLLQPSAGEIALDGGAAERTVSEQCHFLGHLDPVKPALTVAENLRFWTDFLGEAQASDQPGRSLLRPLPLRERAASAVPQARLGEGKDSTPHPFFSEEAPNSPLPQGERARDAGAAFTEAANRSRQADAVVTEALDAVGLGPLAELPGGYLSAGQRRRLSLARLLAVARPVWLLDEPTATLDAAGQKRFADLAQRHVAGGGILVAATHLPLGLTGAREMRLVPP